MGTSERIGIFGGSFNPPHNGHVGVCHYCFAQDLVDRILIIPCWQHPYDKPMVPYNDRLAMCRLAVGGIAGVECSEVERELGGVSHTVRTVRRLRERHPKSPLFILIGDDLEAETSLWKDVEAIRQEAEFLRMPRHAGSPIPNVSATDIRDSMAAGLSIADLVPQAVAEYIAERGLFLRHLHSEG